MRSSLLIIFLQLGDLKQSISHAILIQPSNNVVSDGGSIVKFVIFENSNLPQTFRSTIGVLMSNYGRSVIVFKLKNILNAIMNGIRSLKVLLKFSVDLQVVVHGSIIAHSILEKREKIKYHALCA
jgi:hypothetical protein